MKAPIFLFLAASASLPAAIVVDANNSDFILSGTTTIREGNLATFNGPNKWTTLNGTISGSDRTGTTLATTGSNDFYVNYGAGALGNTPANALPVADNRYVEISYSLGGNWTGAPTSHALRLDTTSDPAAFVTFSNRGLIPNADGSHTIIIDLNNSVTAPLTGDWSTVRWDFFNVAGNNGGKTFTIDKVTFASSITAVPEPSTALLGLLALPVMIRRRR